MSERTTKENTELSLGGAASGESVNKSTPVDRVEFYCESFENGRKIGGFSFMALHLPEALLKAARHGEVLIRPHITDLHVRTLAEAKAELQAQKSRATAGGTAEQSPCLEPSGTTGPASMPDDLDQVRQILAADMTLQPSNAPLPEPRSPLGPVALAVYGLVQEVRQRRSE
jgi:hypothetical protein